MDIITRINWVDLLVVTLMFRMSYVALHDGLSHVIFPLISSLLTLIAGLRYYAVLGSSISRNLFNMPVQMANAVAFILLVVIIGLIFKVLRVLADKVIKVEWHPLIERSGGLIFGVARASVVTSIVLTAIMLVPLPYLQRSVRDRSLTGTYFVRLGPVVYGKAGGLLPFLKERIDTANSDKLTQALMTDKSILIETPKKEKPPAWEEV